MNPFRHPELLKRAPQNPILTAADWPYPVHTVFNAGAVILESGETLLLCRVEDRRGMSHLTAARSADGVSGWVIDSEPTFLPLPEEHPEELWGIEDPRITYVPEEGLYLIAYTAFSKDGPGVAVATTTDFRDFQRCGLAMQADDKDAAFFPHRIDGSYALIHRPTTEDHADMWISYSPDLVNWGQHRIMLAARRGGWWDAGKVGLSPPPIQTDRGWLVIYHGVRRNAAGSIYRLGLALMALEDPSLCILRSQSWFFGPETDYETAGDVANVVFPCGVTVGPDGDSLRVYYGAADTSLCLAEGSIREMLAWLDEDGTSMTGVHALPAELAAMDPGQQ